MLNSQLQFKSIIDTYHWHTSVNKFASYVSFFKALEMRTHKVSMPNLLNVKINESNTMYFNGGWFGGNVRMEHQNDIC